jgi:hypothetical protein
VERKGATTVDMMELRSASNSNNMGIREFIFREQREKNGRVLPFSRWDTVLGAACGFALLVACAYAAEIQNPRTPIRFLVLATILLLIGLLAQNRRAVFGGGFGILCGRLLIGALGPHHPVFFLLTALPTAAIAWALLRDLR